MLSLLKRFLLKRLTFSMLFIASAVLLISMSTPMTGILATYIAFVMVSLVFTGWLGGVSDAAEFIAFNVKKNKKD